ETMVIAEIGCNWKNIEEAKRMIWLANESGATHVKFQAYTQKDIDEAPEEIREHLTRIKLNPTKLIKLKEYADEVGIEFIVTPTSSDRYEMLKKVGVNTIKIREKDKGNTELCAPIFTDKKKMIVSTSVIPTLINLVNPNVMWMYCVPKYPPKLEEIELEKNVPYIRGYSNHYPDIFLPLYAVMLGAEVIEVHVTLERSRNDIDIKVSIDFDELEQLTHMICLYEKMRIKRSNDYAL
ncbi:MAG: N-acetylneuraminate synthase family protein, partial [Candidatus Daviesbacteria bacterium]|nr:N-acetylneuraminate synthase family protein [Candidatus Daviesbacteria bacterium]